MNATILIAAGEWQPMLDLDPLFDVQSLSTLAATIEYDFQNMFVVVIVTVIKDCVSVCVLNQQLRIRAV